MASCGPAQAPQPVGCATRCCQARSNVSKVQRCGTQRPVQRGPWHHSDGCSCCALAWRCARRDGPTGSPRLELLAFHEGRHAVCVQALPSLFLRCRCVEPPFRFRRSLEPNNGLPAPWRARRANSTFSSSSRSLLQPVTMARRAAAFPLLAVVAVLWALSVRARECRRPHAQRKGARAPGALRRLTQEAPDSGGAWRSAAHRGAVLYLVALHLYLRGHDSRVRARVRRAHRLHPGGA